jgi:uncharacterized membrane protein
MENMLKKTDIGANEREIKRQEIVGRKGRSKTWLGLLLLVIAAAVVSGAGWLMAQQSPEALAASSAEVSGREGATFLALGAAQFDDGKARQFAYRSPDGLNIRYFLIKSSDGVIRAAFDACDVCWPSNRGYAQDGDAMVCRNCGRRFPSTRINVEQGGCNPSPLKRTIEGGRVIIQTSDLKLGARYFASNR